VQLIGWGTFELVVIAQAAQTAFPNTQRWIWVVAAGLVTTLLTLRPLGTLRLLRRVVTIAVAISLAYLAWHLLAQPRPSLGEGSWESFWKGADAAIAVAISWIPVASDYSRHARTPLTAFTAATVGYSIAQIVNFLLGLVALALVAGNGDAVFGRCWPRRSASRVPGADRARSGPVVRQRVFDGCFRAEPGASGGSPGSVGGHRRPHHGVGPGHEH